MSLETILISSGAILVLGATVAFVVLRKSVRHKGAIAFPFNFPSVTVIRPIKGLDAGAEENIKAAMDPTYPGRLETIFVFDDENEPAVPLVRKAIEAHESKHRHGTARILYCGQPPANFTGKLNAMIKAYREAKGDLVAFADSDTRPKPGTLTALVATLLQSPKNGSAFAPVVSNQKPLSAGDAGYALLLNGLYGPTAAALSRLMRGNLPYIMGQFTVLRREAVEAVGGLESAEGQLVDDMYIGARLNAAGYRNAVGPLPVPIFQEGLRLHEFLTLYRRWITFSRTGLPQWSFRAIVWLPGILFLLGMTGTAAALAVGSWPAAGINFLAPLIVSQSVNLLHKNLGGHPIALRHAWVSFALMAVTPLVLASTLFVRHVSWRGRNYRLNVKSRLSEGRPLAADEGLALTAPASHQRRARVSSLNRR